MSHEAQRPSADRSSQGRRTLGRRLRPQSQAAADDDLNAALDAEPAARALFDALDSANRYAVLYRVHQAKTPEKRAAKIVDLVAKLARGETFHPRRNQARVPKP